ncbi:SDR family oxidoreductase [Prochlorococcus sp. MIT 1223]|uniref:SDR family NAD(P)-dependent oxidoreductase n=1 Tax=Prochlorococcus sp. MIT 1223 TaxID=3096217 RepID=UPI002A76321B|nr:SDR family oxidoreductase [Prochlorococcus sp. MIT 1223]
MNLDLKGKTALITGSSKGIGLQIARSLYNQGCNIVLNSRDSDRLKIAIDSLPGSISVIADVTKVSEAKYLTEMTIKAFGKLDILVCNVGNSKSVSPGNESLEDWKTMMNDNLYSTTNMVEASINYLEKTKGNIICISSICGNETIPGAPITYSTAKAALNKYVRGISRNLAQKSVRINAISPGNIYFEGSTWDLKIKSDPKIVEQMLNNEVPMKTFGKPDDIANLVCYLASPFSSFMTGSIITLDGGQIRG